ncbi:MAG: type II secretion system protein [Rubrivivax sp.]
MTHRVHSRGYSVIELVVVLGILGVLAALAQPLLDLVEQREKERELRRALWEIRDAIDTWHTAHDSGALAGGVGAGDDRPGPFPPDLASLAVPRLDARPERKGARMQFLRRVPRDPFADPRLPAARTWGLRSFQSPADAPQPGEDVYDVFSLSTQRGLNGIPLRDW